MASKEAIMKLIFWKRKTIIDRLNEHFKKMKYEEKIEHLKAIVPGRPHMDIGNAGIGQQLRGATRDLVGRRDSPRAVDDAVVRTITPDDVV